MQKIIRNSLLLIALLGSNVFAQSAPAQASEGKALYERICAACHAPSNVMVSSPKAGDKAAWARRLQKGLEQTTANAVSGIGAMPARGACTSCSPAQLREAIRFMAGLETTSGAEQSPP
ncbi:c-type cytochrome [Uliginosibacterium sediminicola]|uniref:C-type cytochrome n=1 Tax=Uliginosibacterium sediminicola TaxID=2024550 RepID=A0ABU9YTQ3_9RHOO